MSEQKIQQLIDQLQLETLPVEGTLFKNTYRSTQTISNGEPLLFRIAFKPTATISQPQATVTSSGEASTLAARGRHEPCVLPRAVVMVEAMTALVLLDHALRQRAQDCLPR